MNTEIIKIPKINTSNLNEGFLTFIESQHHIPFEIKRVYYTYEVKKDIIRGHHAHKKLKQILICIYGKIEVEVDNGKLKKQHILDNPSEALYLGEGVWHTMKWLKDNSILLVLASDYYNENDYIRNYDEFIEMVKGGYWNENTF
ncbi:sugar 3,4-ketoisomerase [Marinitoga lauensis]|uniref:sugar 3,4-ketoisomerase n=1 Tax=Marinitoga lauensis TaxID=2201189 RepID=UPI0010139FE7|nr:FdtA/QdtA family cupin domain-containing protein [Marinitoga lauensis]